MFFSGFDLRCFVLFCFVLFVYYSARDGGMEGGAWSRAYYCTSKWYTYSMRRSNEPRNSP